MRKRVMIILVGILSMVLVSCTGVGHGKTEQENGPGNTQEELTPSPAPTGDGEPTTGLSQLITDRRISLLQGKRLEPLDKVGEDGKYYCNLEENLTRIFLRLPEEYPVLVCKDPVYDITYYVNYGRDYLIYAKRGDASECVVPIPARDLYCREGILYFRTEDYNLYEFDSFTDGAVLAYNPADGSVEVVIDEPVFEMAVYPDGIFYVISKPSVEEDGSISKTSTQRYKYYYSFADRESKAFGPMTLHTVARWKGYQLVMEFVDEEDVTKTVYHLETPDGESAGILPGLTERLEAHRGKKDLCYLESYHIQGDYIYYIDNETESLLRYDMESGEEITVVRLALPSLYARAFIIYNDAVYFGNDIRYSFKEKKQYKVDVKGNMPIKDFYTDGDHLYVLANGRLWLYEEKKTGTNGWVSSVLEGRSCLCGCYEGILHPVGE